MRRYGIALGLALLFAQVGCRRWEPQPVACYPIYCPPCPQTTTYVQPAPSACAPVSTYTTPPALPR